MKIYTTMKHTAYNLGPSPFISMYRSAPIVTLLLAANSAVFIMIHLFPSASWFAIFGLVPAHVLKKYMLWQLVTYMFLHAGLMHLVLNMLMLWFFAPALERAWGSQEFLRYYFLTGVGAAFCSALATFGSRTPIVGASGAIFGILVAFSLLYPETVILIFFVFPMKIRHAVLFLAGINLLGAFSSPGSGIAYFAHLGGGLIGYLYLKREAFSCRLRSISVSSFRNWLLSPIRHNLSRSRKHLDTEVDRILDKIARHGMESLTKSEEATLRQKSRKRGSRS